MENENLFTLVGELIDMTVKDKKDKNIGMKKHFVLLLLFLMITIAPYSFTINEVILSTIFVITGALFIFYLIRTKVRSRISKFELITMVLVLLSMIVSIFMSSDKVLSFLNSTYIGIFIMTYIYVSFNRDKERYIIKSIIIAGSIYSAISIVINLFNPYNRLEGLFNYANSTAIFLAICSILYFSNHHWILEERFGSVYKACNLIIISALFATESRGGIIIYLVALLVGERKSIINKLELNVLGLLLAICIVKKLELVYFLALPLIGYIICFANLEKSKLRKRKNNYIYIPKLIIYLILLAASIVFFFNRLLEVKLTNGQFQERIVFISDGFNMLKKNLLGIGAGQYNKLQFIYQSANYDTKYVHNGFIQIGLDFGILALGLFIIYIVYLLCSAIRLKKINQWIIVMAIILAHALFDFSLNFIALGVLLATSMAFLKANETEVVTKSLGENVRLYIGASIILINLILVIVILPYELIYNYALYKSNYGTTSAYNTLKYIEKFPLKDNRFYFKLGSIESLRYDETGDDSLLTDSIRHFNKYIDLEKSDARAKESLSAVYFKMGKSDEGERVLKQVIKTRPYYPSPYSKLVELYYYNIKEAANKGDINTVDKYADKADELSKQVDSSLKNINTRAKYMNNQLTKGIDDEHRQTFQEIREGHGDGAYVPK